MGQHEYGLKSLADDQLLAGLASIVSRRNQITAEFLAYLAELDERQLFLDLGFSSLFEYCVEKLGLCESTAGRHIGAARVCRNHPEVFGMVASGALHASALSLMKRHLTPENAGELFELCAHRSTRRVEELLAARFPRPDVRDLVRRLPTQARNALNVGSSAEPVQTNASSQEQSAELQLKAAPLCEQRIESKNEPVEPVRQLSVAAEFAASKCRLEPLSRNRYGVHFTADGEFRALLERVRGLAGHRLPSGDLMTLVKRGLEAYERELEKERFAVGRKALRRRHFAQPSSGISPGDLSEPEPRTLERPAPGLPQQPDLSTPNSPQSAPQPKASPGRKRQYSASVLRAVFVRDGKQCSYVSPDGRRCSARRCLELDHIEPFALGGAGTIENLRLRCRAHNQRYARLYFGASRVDAALRDSRRRRVTRRG